MLTVGSLPIWGDLESCAAQMWVCQYAEQQLAVPATTQSVFWNMAFFYVYWFLSRPNLKWGGEGTANHSSRRPTVLNLSDDRSGKCMCRVLHWGGALNKSIFENVGQIEFKLLRTTIKRMSVAVTARSSGECAGISNPFMSFKRCLWQVISYYSINGAI